MYLIPKVSEIRTRRLDVGLSQHSLSRTAGLGGQAINRIESGETRVFRKLELEPARR